jgi:hypothetical protein
MTTKTDAYGRDLAEVKRAEREAAALDTDALRDLVSRLTSEGEERGLVGWHAIHLEAARDELRRR